MAARRDQSIAASAVAEHLDDPRAQLPAELRNTEITQQWVAWDAAHRGHPVSYPPDSLGVPRVIAIAVRLLTLAGHLPARGGA